MNKLHNGVYRGLCLFFHDSLSRESSDFKSARCQAGIFGTLEILAFQNKKLENNVLITNNDEIRIENTLIRYCTLL